jgi:polysaccharide export outer membrane protein
MRALEAIETRTGFRVCDGKICLPHLAPLEVADLTLTEAKEKIQAAYREQLSHAQIFINFKIQRERQVQVIGAGQAAIAVDGRMRLSEVLAEARIPPSANLFKSYVMRNGQQLPIDLYQLLHEGNESQNIIMQGGDQIFIANETDASVIVTGEIHRSLVIPIPYGSLSLRAALAIAGGIPFTGNKGCIQIIRGDLIRPKIYCLAWKEILLYPNQSLLLMPGDIVVISETPITQWNRFINQLQPSTACMQTGYNLYEIYNQMH